LELNIKSNAKINIGLNVIKKRDDGYHELDMIMAPIDLSDNLKIKFLEKKRKSNYCNE
jgi:4-diphosphocytidyl-2-C-methyl-D-erythritol kinase